MSLFWVQKPFMGKTLVKSLMHSEDNTSVELEMDVILQTPVAEELSIEFEHDLRKLHSVDIALEPCPGRTTLTNQYLITND